MCKQLKDFIGEIVLDLKLKLFDNNCNNNCNNNINIIYNNSASEEQRKLDDIFRYGKNPTF